MVSSKGFPAPPGSQSASFSSLSGQEVTEATKPACRIERSEVKVDYRDSFVDL